MYKFLDRILPNEPRSWLALGLFLLMIYILSLVAFVPNLDKSQLFTALASGVVGSSFGSAVGYWYATTKGSTDSKDLVQSAMDLAKGKSINVEPPATIEVKE